MNGTNKSKSQKCAAASWVQNALPWSFIMSEDRMLPTRTS